ncbi:MAG: metallophosphoesterase family protein [Methanomassiliicoccus sp.]|nr:metallophosphoesterase family protein [Methanomassiliicoccus sp.]
MRFLILSDIHGRDVAEKAKRLAREQGADAFIILGDITHFGPASWAGEFLSRLDLPVYAVPGNCDPPELVSREIEAHGTLLHGRKVNVDGHALVGLGGSNPTIFETPFEMEEADIESALRPLMEKGAIMVLHAPPQGINDRISTGLHVGSEAILRLVDEYRPRVVLSGHIHEARGILEKDGTLFVNPGAAKEGHAALLDLDGGQRATMLELPGDD